MLRASFKKYVAVAGVGLVLAAAPACGKKAALRLTDSRTPEHAPAVRARVRESRVTLDFRAPAHRTFPEREEPWVLARILRQTGSTSEAVEAGTILMGGGFEFGSPLTWSDEAAPANNSFIYRVEFRDAARRRRALSDPLTVSWDQVPGAPSRLTATGHLKSIILDWAAPDAAVSGLNYRIYRREAAQALFEQASPDLIAGTTWVDSRIAPDREYCYEVRATLTVGNLEIEGPASPAHCARATPDQAAPTGAP